MPPPADPLFASHPRSFAENLYVYPVLSRRAGGISIGVNLNRDQFCNFHCVYCQVDRAEHGKGSEDEQAAAEIDLTRLSEELNWTIEEFTSERLFQAGRFHHTPALRRRLNDIAFSGDGEPTASPHFAEAVAVCAGRGGGINSTMFKLVLITNASLLHKSAVQEALTILDRNNGEIWAKLDAGTEAYYAQVARTPVAWRQIIKNLQTVARVRPIVIQTLFMRIHGQLPPAEEIAAYGVRLREILAAGGKIKLVQIHTIAESLRRLMPRRLATRKWIE